MFSSFQTAVKKIPLLLLALAAATLLFVAVLPETSIVSSSYAAGESLGIDGDIKPDAANDEESLQKSIVSIINQLLLFLGVLLLGIIIYAGIIIITSDGEEEGLTKGRKMIIYAVIGVIIIVLSYSIVNWIGGLTGAGDSAV